MRRLATISCRLGLVGLTGCWSADALAKDTKLVLIAGKKSHAPREHEYEQGLHLLPHCLGDGHPDLVVNHFRRYGGAEGEGSVGRVEPIVWLESRDKEPWLVEHPIAEAADDHGIGVGNINGNGKPDIVLGGRGGRYAFSHRGLTPIPKSMNPTVPLIGAKQP